MIVNNYCMRFFVISRRIQVEVSRSRRLRLITLTETLIIMAITKTESNNFLLTLNDKEMEVACFCFFTNGKQALALRRSEGLTLRRSKRQLPNFRKELDSSIYNNK